MVVRVKIIPTLVQLFINSLTYLYLREDYFPLTLALSPIGGEGKEGTGLRLCPKSFPGAVREPPLQRLFIVYG